MRYWTALLCLSLTCALTCTSATAAEEKKPAGTLITFSTEASRTVANDMAHAAVFAQATDTASADVARKVNGLIAQAMATAKNFPDVKVKSGATWTSPVYSKNGRNIEAWQMRSELQLESPNIAALGELIGKLQQTLGVSQMTLQPALDTRRRAEEQVTLEALNAFQAKAQRIAGNFKKYYRVVRMNVDSANPGPVYPQARVAMMKAEDASMPIAEGDSLVSVTVSGEIELVD